ncbi:thioredoxin domain-containing protein 11-like isoform X2 [Acropora palmata]|uniref:thioredoxin domain-containing protein 11-like isoform X2 n=1 Tax=Acropora palmata TaxID=6131 RepID=UPI003DA08E8B
MIWKIRILYFLLGDVLLSFLGSAWFLGSGDGQIAKLSRSKPLFPSTGKVVEISDGSVERFSALLQKNKISFVLIYAPWSGQSLALAHEFDRAAKILYKEISFFAINCWIGSCNKQWGVEQFPKVVVIHSSFHRIEYKGPHKSSKMIGFLQSIIRPFMYIGTDAEFYQAKQSNQELIISYFGQPRKRNNNYTIFFNLTLQFKAEEPSPAFAVITSAKLALNAGLDCLSGVAYYRVNHDVLNFTPSDKFTVETLSSWIEANRYKLVVELKLRSDNKGQFVDQLRQGPALILFLPLKLHASQESQHLWETYISMASQYFNCSCRRKTNQKTSLMSDQKNTTRTFKQFRVNKEMLDSLKSSNFHKGWIILDKEWKKPHLLASKSICQSLQIRQQSNLKNKLNVCEVCYFCQYWNCQLNLLPGLENIKSEILSQKNDCSSIRPRNYQLSSIIIIICCGLKMTTNNTPFPYQALQQSLDSKASKQMGESVDDLFSKLLATLTSLTTRKDIPSLENKVAVEVESSSQIGDLQIIPSIDENNENLCATADNATAFAGAGCFSNRSLNFFVMDSMQYWSVAEKLGVHSSVKDRRALVIADLEADAQFVLDEELQITNVSIVAFVMAYMTGNLSRRLRSSNPKPKLCLTSQPCVVEVVTSNFHEIVLDETKDVLLLYYAPWCAFCHVLWPVLLTVAKFFHKTTGVIIARKDFAVRFPDSLERTGANMVQFTLGHGVMAKKAFKDFRVTQIVTNQVYRLEELLHKIEEHTGRILIRQRHTLIGDMRRQRISELRPRQIITYLTKEQADGSQCDHLKGILDNDLFLLEERLQQLIKGSAKALQNLLVSDDKMKRDQKQLSELLLENERFVLSAVQLELWQTLTAMRRRATQFQISSIILRAELTKTLSEESCPRSLS